MFTGIIEEKGEILSIQGQKDAFSIRVAANEVLKDVKLGDSISTNGVCLTVTSFDQGAFTADVMPETYQCTTFHQLKIGDAVNLERAMKLGDRFGGHIVSGHVDGVGKIISMDSDGNATRITIKAAGEVMKYILRKGSVALDGISLTVARCDNETFQVSIIPETARETTLLKKAKDDLLNIECDIVGKYIERLTLFKEPEAQSHVTESLLTENGFI